MHEHAATRLFVFPVAGIRRWAFVAKPPTLVPPAGASPKPSGAAAGSGPVAGSAASPGWLGGAMGMARELMDRTRVASNSNERVEIVADYFADSMHNQWVKLEESPERSWKRRVFNWGTALLSRLKASETLFKTVPKNAPGLEIVYPAGLHPTLVRRRVRFLAQQGQAMHRCYLYGWTGVLPFIMVLGVLPVPNLPFFWNVFRIHAHWSSIRGSKRLQELTTLPHKGKEEDGKKKESSPVRIESLKLVPSKELAALTLGPSSIDKLSDEDISALCKKLDLDSQLVAKWRDQK